MCWAKESHRRSDRVANECQVLSLSINQPISSSVIEKNSHLLLFVYFFKMLHFIFSISNFYFNTLNCISPFYLHRESFILRRVRQRLMSFENVVIFLEVFASHITTILRIIVVVLINHLKYTLFVL